MTDKPGSGSDDGAGDGLDAWIAANFPAQPTEPPPAQPVDPTPTQPVDPTPTQPVDPTPVQPTEPSRAQPNDPTPAAPGPTTNPPFFGSTPPAPPVPPAPAPPAPAPPASAAWPPVSPPPGQQNPPAHEPTTAPPVFPPMSDELEGIPPATELPPPPTEAFADLPGPSGIDALFGETKFREYEEGPAASENPFARRVSEAAAAPDGEPPRREGFKKPQKVLLWVAGSLVAVLALVVLFILGTKLPVILGPAPGALVTPSMTPSPTPTPTVMPIGPVEPGEYLWDELLGGECINPYEGPWQISYTVVDCENPHAAQLVTRGIFVVPEGTFGYPGAEALQSQVNLVCTAPAVVDYAAASAYTDIQFEASYALSVEDWVDGNHSYNCFLSRSAGGELTGSIAVPQVVPEPAPSEEPAP